MEKKAVTGAEPRTDRDQTEAQANRQRPTANSKDKQHSRERVKEKTA